MHCVIEVVLGLDSFLEEEVVMALSERVKVDVSIVLPSLLG